MSEKCEHIEYLEEACAELTQKYDELKAEVAKEKRCNDTKEIARNNRWVQLKGVLNATRQERDTLKAEVKRLSNDLHIADECCASGHRVVMQGKKAVDALTAEVERLKAQVDKLTNDVIDATCGTPPLPWVYFGDVVDRSVFECDGLIEGPERLTYTPRFGVRRLTVEEQEAAGFGGCHYGFWGAFRDGKFIKGTQMDQGHDPQVCVKETLCKLTPAKPAVTLDDLEVVS